MVKFLAPWSALERSSSFERGWIDLNLLLCNSSFIIEVRVEYFKDIIPQGGLSNLFLWQNAIYFLSFLRFRRQVPRDPTKFVLPCPTMVLPSLANAADKRVIDTNVHIWLMEVMKLKITNWNLKPTKLPPSEKYHTTILKIYIF